MGALRVEKLQFSGKMSAFKQVESMRLAEEEARLKAKEEERLKAVEAKRVSDEKAAMAALLAEADATKKLLAEEKATTAALKAAAEREHARAALLEEMEAAEKRLAEEKARRAKVMLEVMLKVMLNRKLSIAFNEWQATAAQTKAEVEVELQEAIQKAVWPCGEVVVHEEDKLRAAEWGRRAKAEPWLHRMTKETCIQTSGGTPPVSGKPRRSQWFLLFSCIALVCCVVLMVMLMPVMSEDAHVEKPKNFQDIESASPQDIEEAMNQLKEETRAEEAIKDQKARILKEENERAAKLGPILQKQKQDYAKKKRAVDAQEKMLTWNNISVRLTTRRRKPRSQRSRQLKRRPKLQWWISMRRKPRRLQKRQNSRWLQTRGGKRTRDYLMTRGMEVVNYQSMQLLNNVRLQRRRCRRNKRNKRR